MPANEWLSSPQPAVTPMELVRLTEEKALRFAESPPVGYLAGYSPRHQPFSDGERDRVTHVSGWNDELSWLYAVAEQDIPDNCYRWGIVEHAAGRFKLVLEPVKDARD